MIKWASRCTAQWLSHWNNFSVFLFKENLLFCNCIVYNETCIDVIIEWLNKDTVVVVFVVSLTSKFP